MLVSFTEVVGTYGKVIACAPAEIRAVRVVLLERDCGVGLV